MKKHEIWSKQKIRLVSNEMISNINSVLNLLSISELKNIKKQGLYCNPIYDESKQDYIRPSKNTKLNYQILSKVVCNSPHFKHGATSESEIKSITRVYKHFNYVIAEGSTFGAGFIQHLVEYKIKKFKK